MCDRGDYAMNQPSRNHILIMSAICLVTFAVGRGTAAVFPTPGTELFYSGQLTDDVGAPLLSSEELVVQFFDAAVGGFQLCATESTEVDLASTLGGFRLELPVSCVSAVVDGGDVWAQLTVSGARMPRQKIGAVPYALVARESQQAAVAATALEADRARSVADGSIGAAALAVGAVTAEKTSFGEDLLSDVDGLSGRLDTLETAQQAGARTRITKVYHPGLTAGQDEVEQTLSPGQAIDSTLAAVDFESFGSVWCFEISGCGYPEALAVSNAGAANCSVPARSFEIPMKVRFGIGPNNSASGNLQPEQLLLGFEPKGCTSTTDDSYTKQCRFFSAGIHRISIEYTTAPSIVPTGCSAPRLLRSGRWTFSVEDTRVNVIQ